MKVRPVMILALLLLGCSRRSESVGTLVQAVAAVELVPEQRSYPADPPVSLGVVPSDREEPCGIPGGAAADPGCNLDLDGDGVVMKFDCDDADPSVSPFAWDVPCDGVDQNCNGFDECDLDEDGILSQWDCDDRDARVGIECQPWYHWAPARPLL